MQAQKFFAGYRLGSSAIFDNVKNEDFGDFKSRVSHEVELGYTVITFKKEYALLVGLDYSKVSLELEDGLLLSQTLNQQNVKNSIYNSDNIGFFIGGHKILKQQNLSFIPSLKLKYLFTSEKISNSAFQNGSVQFNYFDQEIGKQKNNKISLLGKNILLLDISNPIAYQIKKVNIYIEPFFTIKLSNFKNENIRYNLINYGVGCGAFF